MVRGHIEVSRMRVTVLLALLTAFLQPAFAGAAKPKVYSAQLNPWVRDYEGNANQIIEAFHHGVAAGADMVVTPEMMLPGYPANDLLDKVEETLTETGEQIERIKEASRGSDVALVVGHVRRTPYRSGGKLLQNVISVI